MLILSTFLKLPFGIKIFVLSIFEWPFYSCFTVLTTFVPKMLGKAKTYVMVVSSLSSMVVGRLSAVLMLLELLAELLTELLVVLLVKPESRQSNSS